MGAARRSALMSAALEAHAIAPVVKAWMAWRVITVWATGLVGTGFGVGSSNVCCNGGRITENVAVDAAGSIDGGAYVPWGGSSRCTKRQVGP